MKPMSLAQYRTTVKLKGQKSRLFSFKSEIFEAIDMGMSLAHIQGFLALHNIKISKQALHRWILSQKTYQPKTNVAFTPFLHKSEQKSSEYSHINGKEPKVEPKEAPSLTNDDDFYNHLRKVADKRAKWLGTNPYITQETLNENSSLQQ